MPKSSAAAEPEAEAGVGEDEKSEEVDQSSQQEAPPAEQDQEEAVKEVPVTEGQAEEPVETGNEADAGAVSSPPPVRASRRAESPSPPPRERRDRGSEYAPSYEQEFKRDDVPARLPTTTSFSSFVAPERDSYKAISPWVSTSGKYRNEVQRTYRVTVR